MVPLPVDTTSGIWHQVLGYVQARRAELVQTCVSLSVSDVERRDAAARIAELDELIEAPQATRRATENRQEPRETY